jgi:hypothetical protein
MELAQDVLEVVLDRVLADNQSARDLSVGQSVGHQLEHLQLARGEIMR